MTSAAELGLPERRACRCGAGMALRGITRMGAWWIAEWECRRCGREYAAQVDADGNIAEHEWVEEGLNRVPPRLRRAARKLGLRTVSARERRRRG